MRVDNIEVEEYIAVEGMPIDCAYHKLFGEAMVDPDRKGNFWFELHTHWLATPSGWYRWN